MESIWIVFNKEYEIISIHRNQQFAEQVAKDYIRSFNFTKEECNNYFEMLEAYGYVVDLVYIEEYEVDD